MTSIITSLPEAVRQVGHWLDWSAKREDSADAAVKAVLTALNQTMAYIADWENGSRSRGHERNLIRLWTDAAVGIRRHDPEFAQALQMKAEYWADPEKWSDVDVERAGIGIQTVAGKARSLLGGAI